LILTAGSLQ